MTENEARLILDVRISRFDHAGDVNEALEIAKQALEEVQQYREIGTVEECREAREKQKPNRPLGGADIAGNKYMICPNCSAIVEDGEWRADYCPDCGQAIQWENKENALIETPKEAIETIKSNMPTSGYQMLRESLDMAIESLEKQIPKKPRKQKGNCFGKGKSGEEYHEIILICPICGSKELKMGYPCKCGQTIKWDEDLEDMEDGS